MLVGPVEDPKGREEAPIIFAIGLDLEQQYLQTRLVGQ